MAGWASLRPKTVCFDETRDLIMGVIHQQFQTPGNDLIQNCDLPPPVKVFSVSDNNRTVFSNMSSKKYQINNRSNLGVIDGEEFGDEGGKLGLLKALRLSQTRAREAEAKCADITKERDSLAGALVDDSLQVFGYRQLLKLLEFQVSKLQNEREKMCRNVYCDCEKCVDDDDDGGGGSDYGVRWIMVALCLGIAGLGVAIGCRYYWF